jgi:predicted  nucleic acid-binding Zn-ribbon protein
MSHPRKFAAHQDLQFIQELDNNNSNESEDDNRSALASETNQSSVNNRSSNQITTVMIKSVTAVKAIREAKPRLVP